jgi:hypothetical protein
MSTSNNIRELFKKLRVRPEPDMDRKVHDGITRALQEWEKSTSAVIQPNMWRIVVKSRITKLAAAAVIIIAAFWGLDFVGGPNMASIAWGELVERVERSHDEYMKRLLLAVEEKDTEKIEFHADLLSEFWQRLGWLAKVQLDPKRRAELLARIAQERAVYDSHREGDDIGVQIFLAHADQFSDWLGKIQDVTWINETIHVCKQMEEYLEEIRDAGRSSQKGLSYVEHLMPSFLAYCGWFDQLPWGDPDRHVGPDTLLTAIERDLEIARREINDPKNKDAERFAKRCVQQTQKNVVELCNRVQELETHNEHHIDISRKLNRQIRHLAHLVTYAQVASWDIRETEQIQPHDAFRRLLRKNIGRRGPFGDYFVEQIDQTLVSCKELLGESGSDQ